MMSKLRMRSEYTVRIRPPFRFNVIHIVRAFVFSKQPQSLAALLLYSICGERPDALARTDGRYKCLTRSDPCADYDGDGYIGRDDLVKTLTALCGEGELSKEEVDEVATKILVEADLDGDERLSYVEFDNVVARAPDFVSSFRVRI